MPAQRLPHRRLVLAVLLVGAVLVVALLLTRGGHADAQADARADARADAEALVVMVRIDADLAAVPRFGESVFRKGQVARAVADELGVDADEVVPDHVSLVTEPESIVFAVVGHADDRATAARIANTAADAFVRELNAAGTAVGRFTLHKPAQP